MDRETRKQVDYMRSERNAELLVKNIRSYWQKRGVQIHVWSERDPNFHSPPCYIVRSNLVLSMKTLDGVSE